MVCVNSWWPVGRDGTSTKENGTHHGDKIRLLLQLMDGGKRHGRAESWIELGGTRVMEAVEDYLENCANVKVDIEVLECLMEPENHDIFLRYILQYSTRGGSNIFQLFDTSKRQDHFVANRKRWLEGHGKNGARQESVCATRVV